MKQCKMLHSMKQIRREINDISALCGKVYENANYWLGWPNECAHTDRVIEKVLNQITEMSELMEKLKVSATKAKAKYEGQYGEPSPRIPSEV